MAAGFWHLSMIFAVAAAIMAPGFTTAGALAIVAVFLGIEAIGHAIAAMDDRVSRPEPEETEHAE